MIGEVGASEAGSLKGANYESKKVDSPQQKGQGGTTGQEAAAVASEPAVPKPGSSFEIVA